jgi:ABC-type dipeptide/oligopeptide/nickel transport system permease component
MNPVHHVTPRQGEGDASMLTPLSLREISHVIALAMAPAFLLAAVAAFSALAVGKMTSIVTRIRTLNTIEDADRVRAHLKADIPRLKRCAKLVGRSLVFLVGTGFVTTCLMVLAFVGALMKWQHETAVAVLFVIALALFAVAFGYLLCEALIWHDEFDHQA